MGPRAEGSATRRDKTYDKTKLSLKGICEVADATEIRIKPGNGGIRICCPSREWRFKVAPKELAMWARALANFARVLEV